MADVTIAPSTVDITVVYGTNNTVQFTLTDSTGGVVDLSSSRVRISVVDTAGTLKIVHTNTSTQHTSSTAGTTRFTLTETDLSTDGLSQRATASWPYDVRRADSAANDVVHVTGLLHVLASASTAID